MPGLREQERERERERSAAHLDAEVGQEADGVDEVGLELGIRLLALLLQAATETAGAVEGSSVLPASAALKAAASTAQGHGLMRDIRKRQTAAAAGGKVAIPGA